MRPGRICCRYVRDTSGKRTCRRHLPAPCITGIRQGTHGAAGTQTCRLRMRPQGTWWVSRHGKRLRCGTATATHALHEPMSNSRKQCSSPDLPGPHLRTHADCAAGHVVLSSLLAALRLPRCRLGTEYLRDDFYRAACIWVSLTFMCFVPSTRAGAGLQGGTRNEGPDRGGPKVPARAVLQPVWLPVTLTSAPVPCSGPGPVRALLKA